MALFCVYTTPDWLEPQREETEQNNAVNLLSGEVLIWIRHTCPIGHGSDFLLFLISRTGFLPLWGLPFTSEFLCWPLRRLAITNGISVHNTPIYYRKSPVPSIELPTNRCSLYL
jgi:hypothetical protein